MSSTKQYSPKATPQPKDRLKAHQLHDLRKKSGLSDETIASIHVAPLTAWEVHQIVHWKTGSGGVIFPYLINDQLVGCRVKLDKPLWGRAARWRSTLLPEANPSICTSRQHWTLPHCEM